MILKPRPNAARTAFTLIELLVVIAIIAVLVSLTAAAVMRALVKGPETQTASEIREMEGQVAAVKREYGVPYLPSAIILREDGQYTSATPGHKASYDFLRQMFGRRLPIALDNNATPSPIDWNQNGTIETTDFVLEGEQCLVFFLGGIQTNANGTPGCIGFSTNPNNPAAVGGTRRGPYYEFKSNRLKPGPNGSGYFVYMDAWGKQPYAYFTSYQSEGYGLYNGDCPSLGVAPYQEPNGKWINPGSCQIISAGRDGQFGPGGQWDPKAGSTVQAGKDDQSNFSGHLLGAPQ